MAGQPQPEQLPLHFDENQFEARRVVRALEAGLTVLCAYKALSVSRSFVVRDARRERAGTEGGGVTSRAS